jgi:hypothetical protein
MVTWQEKVKGIFGPNGYDNSTMRRSLQAIVLYEAKRCASTAMATMKPFQRKAAFLDQCKALVESLDLLYPHQKAEVLWRTATSKEQVRQTREMGRMSHFLLLFLFRHAAHFCWFFAHASVT